MDSKQEQFDRNNQHITNFHQILVMKYWQKRSYEFFLLPNSDMGYKISILPNILRLI